MITKTSEVQMLSQTKIATFLTCRRRFQLRYLEMNPWPSPPLDERAETAVQRGRQFHQILERHFLGLPVQPSTFEDDTLRQWWHAFQNNGIIWPDGRFYPELSLSVPVGRYLLVGRFDLLVLGEEGEEPFAHVYDWKTGRPQGESELREAWQTRLYLGMLAESRGALLANGRSLAPNRLVMTYWYVQEPDAPRTIRYDGQQHAQNWAEIKALIAEIDAQPEDSLWPLTENRQHCRACAYQVICGRQEAKTAGLPDEEGELTDEIEWQLEPETP